jgi:hypothetical protein
MPLAVEADLRFSVEVSGARTVSGHLCGSGTALELRVDEPFVFAGRRDAATVRGVAEGLARRGLSVTVVGPSGPLVTLGRRRRGSWVQRLVTGSPHVRVERGAGIVALLRGRAQRTTVAALPTGELAPPATMWPVAPTFGRHRRVPTTTHDPERGGDPRLVMAPDPHPGPDYRQPVFHLLGDVTTIGSAPDCDIRLAGLAPHHAEVHHDEWDEFVVVRRGPAGSMRVNGAPVDRALLRNACRLGVGSWELSFARAEYADHGRPYGGRIGGELGRQRRQPPRQPRQPPPEPRPSASAGDSA